MRRPRSFTGWKFPPMPSLREARKSRRKWSTSVMMRPQTFLVTSLRMPRSQWRAQKVRPRSPGRARRRSALTGAPPSPLPPALLSAAHPRRSLRGSTRPRSWSLLCRIDHVCVCYACIHNVRVHDFLLNCDCMKDIENIPVILSQLFKTVTKLQNLSPLLRDKQSDEATKTLV